MLGTPHASAAAGASGPARLGASADVNGATMRPCGGSCERADLDAGFLGETPGQRWKRTRGRGVTCGPRGRFAAQEAVAAGLARRRQARCGRRWRAGAGDRLRHWILPHSHNRRRRTRSESSLTGGACLQPQDLRAIVPRRPTSDFNRRLLSGPISRDHVAVLTLSHSF